MSKLRLTGEIGGTRGRVSRRDGTYTRMIRQTGRSYAVKLRKKVTEWSEDQKRQRQIFSMQTKALTEWIHTNEASNTPEYRKLLRAFRRQDSCYTLRGYMMRRGMAQVDLATGTVTVRV